MELDLSSESEPESISPQPLSESESTLGVGVVNREHDPCSPDAAEKPKHQDPWLDGYAMYKKEDTVRPGAKFVQILHVNGNHWVTVSNVTLM